ncbi:CocE/NonD family hydrolase [Agromyces sp. H3Y2-19a]|uniref:CocE/NonD family hydrolase n=1 Tax=Agromyces chromiiresistens TaxID=3030835 RepID=UPI0023B93D10|nr:CocE/NonD family hydrolase [Agromyces chromiiresistens]MDF0512015.1 CocE/NonD family hydrolase [Agromyces chromiiresistens]
MSPLTTVQLPPARRRRRAAGIVAGLAVALVGTLMFPTTAVADDVPELSIVDGVTAPVFDYTQAIRERVLIPVAGVDQDLDGVDDVTAIEIIRPAESDAGLKVPAIIDTSPYYTTLGRGNESQLIADVDGDGLNDQWPLFYDNYFVPRGYAMILAEMDGTANSTGCPMHGGPGDIESMKVVIDWLNGRVAGHYADGTAAVADWDNGKAAMMGKSYDGTLANGVAATGVEGLTTIVPISAISYWYGYSRTGGIAHNSNYPASLSNTVTNPDRRPLCAPVRANLSAIDGDETGDVNPFWAERDYRLDIDDVRASVFLAHGLNDDNVRMSQVGEYWEALGEHDVPRKIWLAKVGHTDPFDYNRVEWVSTIHRWYDYWLQGIDNGIMDEPVATVETDPEVYEDVANWPVPGTTGVEVLLGGTTPGAAGDLRLQPGDGAATATFTGPSGSISEGNAINAPEGSQANRLVFLSEPLTSDLRISGTARVELTASLGQSQANLSALLVDYGTSTRTSRSGEGVVNTTERTCWGAESASDDACYLEVDRRSQTTDVWRAARGALDSSNRFSLADGEAVPVTPGEATAFDFPLEPYDTTFAAGHRIGVVVTTNLSGYSIGGTANASVTVDTAVSRIVLPVVGGPAAAAASGAFGVVDPVSLAFDLGGHGEAMPPQAVAYGSAPVEPAAPSEHGWVFQGWFADAALTTPFDFDAVLVDDAVAYAKWADVASVAVSLEVTPSETSVDKGDSVELAVEALDADGAPIGDVSDLVAVTSSVATDVVDGASVELPAYAGEHVLTATLGAASGSATVTVRPGAPVAVEAPSFTGTPIPGATLTADPGVWDVDGARFSYRWTADGRTIPWADGAALKVNPSISGKELVLTVTARAPGLPAGTASSEPVTVLPKPHGFQP